jgi:hypothetical protein
MEGLVRQTFEHADSSLLVIFNLIVIEGLLFAD